jgi:broad specificity phosphatase PhoE
MMAVEITFETHSTSVDNESGIASGWRDVSLSPTGRGQAKELGERHRGERIDAIFPSDLRRAVETAEIAFPGGTVPLYPDHRLRESDYGTMTGASPEEIDADRLNRIDEPFPNGESLRGVVARVEGFISDLARDWDGKRVVVIGHRATLLAFEHLLRGVGLEEAAAASFEWQPGWHYVLEVQACPPPKS